jgi:hypothetical protein
MRLDRALLADLRTALGSRPIQLYLLLQLVAGIVFVARRGSDTASMVVLIWVGLLLLAFVAWWAGRHRLAHPEPDPVPAAGARSFFALLGVAGLVLWSVGPTPVLGFVLLACGLGGWTWAALRSGGVRAAVGGALVRITRDPRPFVPLLLLVGLPRLIVGGLGFVLGATLALPSGLIQQLAFLIGLFAPLEAWSGRPAAAAVVSALLFALTHVPLVLPDNHGDLAAAVANAVLFQSAVGLIAVLAYRRHRAAVPIGVAHALAIG